MKSPGTLVVFDWDGVIFDTSLLKKIRDPLLKSLGYSADHIRETSDRAKIAKGGYNFHSHAKLLARKGPHNPVKLGQMIYDEIERHPGAFVFPDAKQTILSLKRAGRHLDILTAGHAGFQEYKMARSGLRHLFRGVHVVPSGAGVPKYKIAALRKLAQSHKRVIFLDDLAGTIETVKRSATLRGKVLPILVWRRKEKPLEGLIAMRRLTWAGLKKIAIHNGFRP